jgi:hypothetical protein
VRLFALAPGSSLPELVADLDVALPRSAAPAVPQGKVHVDLAPIGDALLGATHVGYYGEARDGPYPGGWFFSVQDRSVTALAQAPTGEGIISMTADPRRGAAFALTWPRGLLLELDLGSQDVRNHGPVLGAAEAGSRRDGTWVRVCRSLGIEPQTGALFWSDSKGRIVRRAHGTIATVASLPRPEMWLKVAWHPGERVFYGVPWSGGAVFRFDPATLACDEIGLLRVPGSPDALLSTLAFVLDPRTDTIHYLAVGPGVVRHHEPQLPQTVVYLTHRLRSGRTDARGTVRSGDGRWITRAESLFVAGDTAYSVCWAEVPRADRSPRAREVRKHRRHSSQYRFGGYAEEVVLVRFPTR